MSQQTPMIPRYKRYKHTYITHTYVRILAVLY